MFISAEVPLLPPQDEFAGIAQDLTKAVSASEGDKNIVLAFKKVSLDDYTVRQNLNILFEYLRINIILP